MTSLSNDLRRLIIGRLEAASPNQVLAITSALCANEPAAGLMSAAPLVARPRFEVSGDMVTDALTGLMWTRANVPGGRMKWSEAKAAAAGVRLGGYTDWRLPTLRELLSIVDYERSSPAIDTSAFECESAWYWSATPYKPSPGGCAWGVYFGNGGSYADLLDGSGFVRAVRVGQSLDNWF